MFCESFRRLYDFSSVSSDRLVTFCESFRRLYDFSATRMALSSSSSVSVSQDPKRISSERLVMDCISEDAGKLGQKTRCPGTVTVTATAEAAKSGPRIAAAPPRH